MLNRDTSEMPSGRPQWRSTVLKPLVVALLLFSEVGLIASIISLLILSSIHAGFVKLDTENSGSGALSVQSALNRSRSLLWTTLPAVVFTLYRLFREAVVSALVVETPFIELHKSSPTRRTKVRKSVYVDYRTSLSIIAWYEALKNKHTFLGLCMLFSFVVSLALVPLAGGLFAEGREFLVSNATVNLFSVFNPSVDISTADYGLLFDAVSASWINAAPYPAGTDGHYPLPRIQPTEALQNYTISSTAETSQLSLDCRIVDDATIDTVNRTGIILQTNFTTTDRDCAISGDSLQNNNGLEFDYFKTFTVQDCPDWAGRTRLVLFYVRLSPLGTYLNSTLVSCIPSYWDVNGTVSITRSTGYKGQLAETPSFNEQSRSVKELPNLQRRTFEQAVLNVKTINIGGNVSTADRLSELVARDIDSRSLDFSASSIMKALNTIYPAIYTLLCVYHFFPTLEQPIQQNGILTVVENRLHVVVAAAVAMLAILILLVVETLYLIIYLHRHPSILAEEPVGLVGAANLLHESNIHCLVASSHDEPTFDGRLRRPSMQVGTKGRKSKTIYTDGHLLDRDCWVERDAASGRLKIVIETKEDDDGCAKLLHPHSFPGYQSRTTVQAGKHQHVTVQTRPTSVSSLGSSQPDHIRPDRPDDVENRIAPAQSDANTQNCAPLHHEGAADLWTER